MTDTESESLRSAIGTLQLPCFRDLTADVLAAIQTALGSTVNDADRALLIEQALEDWERIGRPGPLLKSIVPIALAAGLPTDLSGYVTTGYLLAFQALEKGGNKWKGLPRAVARRLLSRIPLIDVLLRTEKMSCSQISKILKATDASLDVPFQAIQVIARMLKCIPVLDPKIAGPDLWQSDSQYSLVLFPDSNTNDTCEIAGEEAKKLVPEVDTANLLSQLCRASEASTEPTWPYLQILHYCCTPVEFFDHPPSYLYEFIPRGALALDLFARYSTATANPVLNNAKAVQRLDRQWARNRGGADAHALVALLECMESLPYMTRLSFARVLRAWLHRILELEVSDLTPLPQDITSDEIEHLVARISRKDTNTQGVLEQRIVDGLAMMAFAADSWRPRGIGDSVNASNFSRHKLGDIEFANVDDRSAIALEAHGGHLSKTYVADHHRSLTRIVRQRLDESWAALDDPSAWAIEVIFVAHSRDSGLPAQEDISDVSVTYKYWDYEDLISAACSRAGSIGANPVFRQYAVDPLNEKTIRQGVRDKFVEIARGH